MTADYTYAVEPTGSGSRATLTADVRTSGLWSLLGPVIRAAIRKEDSGQLEALARTIATADVTIWLIPRGSTTPGRMNQAVSVPEPVLTRMPAVVGSGATGNDATGRVPHDLSPEPTDCGADTARAAPPHGASCWLRCSG